MSPLRSTTKSTRKLAGELTRQGHRICVDTVGDLLREEDFSLQSNAKTLEGKQHPDRDTQFRHLNEQARSHQDTGASVICMDTKKTELVGPFKNNGCEWEPTGEPVRVDSHDSPDRELGRAVPYGIYNAPRTPAGSTTPPRSPSSRSAAGAPGGPPIRRPTGH